MIKPAYSFSFLLSINIFVCQNVLYFLDAPRTYEKVHLVGLYIQLFTMHGLYNNKFLFTLAADLLSILTFLFYNGKCFLRVVVTDLQSITVSFLSIDRQYFRWES